LIMAAMGDKTLSTSSWLLLTLTGLSLVCGLVLVVVGSIVLADYNIYLDFVTGSHIQSAVFILVMGVITTIVAAIGLCATLKRHYCLMVLFLSVMVSILFIEVIASIAAFASISNKGQRDAGMRDQLKESIDKYSNDDHSMSAWDLLQTELDCCGLNTVDDWGKFEKKEKHLPRSCCGDLPVTIGDKKVEKCRRTSESLHMIGCEEAFGVAVENNLYILAVLGMLVAVVQLGLVVASGYLVNKWRVPGHCYPCY